MNTWSAIGLACAIIFPIFILAWVWAKRIDNYSLVDGVWAFGIGLIGAFWLLTGHFGLKSWIALGLLAFWSIRLGSHLSRRIYRAHPEEDSRYQKLREVWSGHVTGAFLLFFLGQGLSVLILALPFFFIARDPGSAMDGWTVVGLAVTLIGILGESLADHQMTVFKSRGPAHSEVCREGLWRYSRHPNYFFESIIWLGFYLLACGSPHGWLTFHAPAIITWLLLRVTGLPATEASAIARKGDAYREYQRTTSPFIPWPPRS